ncbi:MAG TPA: hypothetical protein VHE53_02575 [Patescibacteria group bacterium]|nr:hypothetical protein [Patescibacteria group bacterium]
MAEISGDELQLAEELDLSPEALPVLQGLVKNLGFSLFMFLRAIQTWENFKRSHGHFVHPGASRTWHATQEDRL